MRITLLTTEAVPFAKTGGLADVTGALPKALAGLGIHITLIMPKYGAIDTDQFGLTKVTLPSDLAIPLGHRTEKAGVWTATLPGASIPVYFVENDGFFDRPELYVDPATGTDYPDNAARFTFFSRAALQLITALELKPDVIHCNDYQTGLVPAYLNLIYNDDPVFSKIATLYSIHNLSYQGLYPRETMELIGIGYRHFYPMGPFEFWDRVNFMKAGAVYADILNTVSVRYAHEIQSTNEYGHGLEGVLRERSLDLYGIVNGIDYDIWNPETDPLIPAHYDHTDLSGKMKNKEALLKAFDLPVPSDDVPLVGMISRLVPQKGFDILAECLDTIVGLDMQLVILGTGMPEYHTALDRAAEKHPDKIGVRLTFDNQLAHLIEAGSDMFLMPSRYEPCGLNQLYSLRYGTLPVVRATGGLVDTIRDYNEMTGEGTGFVFQDYTAEALVNTLRRAIDIYRKPRVRQRMMRHAMIEDFSWAASAKKYMALYERAVDKKRNPEGE